MGKVLTRDDILSAQDMVIECVNDVPGWGGSVYVRGMTGTERDAFEVSLRNSDNSLNLANIRAKMLVKVICDETGKRIFNDADIPALAHKSAAALDFLFKVAQRLSGLADADVKELTNTLGEESRDGSTSG